MLELAYGEYHPREPRDSIRPPALAHKVANIMRCNLGNGYGVGMPWSPCNIKIASPIAFKEPARPVRKATSSKNPLQRAQEKAQCIQDGDTSDAGSCSNVLESPITDRGAISSGDNVVWFSIQEHVVNLVVESVVIVDLSIIRHTPTSVDPNLELNCLESSHTPSNFPALHPALDSNEHLETFLDSTYPNIPTYQERQNGENGNCLDIDHQNCTLTKHLLSKIQPSCDVVQDSV